MFVLFKLCLFSSAPHLRLYCQQNEVTLVTVEVDFSSLRYILAGRQSWSLSIGEHHSFSHGPYENTCQSSVPALFGWCWLIIDFFERYKSSYFQPLSIISLVTNIRKYCRGLLTAMSAGGASCLFLRLKLQMLLVYSLLVEIAQLGAHRHHLSHCHLAYKIKWLWKCRSM